MPEPLEFGNFFTHFYLLDHTSPELEEKDQTKALVYSIALGVFTLGLVHLGCAIARWCITKQDGKDAVDKGMGDAAAKAGLTPERSFSSKTSLTNIEIATVSTADLEETNVKKKHSTAQTIATPAGTKTAINKNGASTTSSTPQPSKTPQASLTSSEGNSIKQAEIDTLFIHTCPQMRNGDPVHGAHARLASVIVGRTSEEKTALKRIFLDNGFEDWGKNLDKKSKQNLRFDMTQFPREGFKEAYLLVGNFLALGKASHPKNVEKQDSENLPYYQSIKGRLQSIYNSREQSDKFQAKLGTKIDEIEARDPKPKPIDHLFLKRLHTLTKPSWYNNLIQNDDIDSDLVKSFFYNYITQEDREFLNQTLDELGV